MEKQKTILLAEDEDINYTLIEELLFELNVIIIRAKNGIEAVDICKANHEIDLVLMDLKMSGLDGFEATKQIKAINPNLPIVAQTAFATSADRKKAFEVGCSEFIGKPFNAGLFMTKIRQLLGI